MTIYESIAGIMSEGAVIAKDKKNQQQGFKYRGIDDVMNVFRPLLSKYKVFVVPEVIDRQREERQTARGGSLIYSVLTVKYTFYAEDGTSVSAVVVGEGMDSGDKASNKAMAVAMKYAMFQTFCIPTEDMSDPDAETPEPSKPKAAPEPKTAPKKAEDYRCDLCGKTITMVKNGRGQLKKPADIVEFSQKNFGRNLCLECSEAMWRRKMNEEGKADGNS